MRGQRLVAMREGRGTSLCERAGARSCVRGQRLVDVGEGSGSSLCERAEVERCAEGHRCVTGRTLIAMREGMAA